MREINLVMLIILNSPLGEQEGLRESILGKGCLEEQQKSGCGSNCTSPSEAEEQATVSEPYDSTATICV